MPIDPGELMGTSMRSELCASRSGPENIHNPEILHAGQCHLSPAYTFKSRSRPGRPQIRPHRYLHFAIRTNVTVHVTNAHMRNDVQRNLAMIYSR